MGNKPIPLSWWQRPFTEDSPILKQFLTLVGFLFIPRAYKVRLQKGAETGGTVGEENASLLFLVQSSEFCPG